MNETPVKIFPLGDSALTVSFGDEISLELNNRVRELANSIEKNRFSGFIETVPAYSSISIFYDVFIVRREYPEFDSAFEAVKLHCIDAIKKAEEIPVSSETMVEIPVDFSEECAIDLEFVASLNIVSKDKVIDIFVATTYRVFLLGFLPGFAYMGEVDELIAAPRKESPRKLVPRGSVGIAGRQTGVYPFASPGGWQIIGRTNVDLFTPNSNSPTLLSPGDLVKFKSI